MAIKFKPGNPKRKTKIDHINDDLAQFVHDEYKQGGIKLIMIVS
jgi:hypothetical protein